MTHSEQAVYARFRQLSDEVNEKAQMGTLKPWQVDALACVAKEAEAILSGSRRQNERRT